MPHLETRQVRDSGLSEVVEHDRHLGHPPHEPFEMRQLPRADTRVEGPSELREPGRSNALDLPKRLPELQVEHRH